MSWSVNETVADAKDLAKLEVPAYIANDARAKRQFEQAKKFAAQVIRAGTTGGFGKRKVYRVALSGHANEDPRKTGGTITMSVTQDETPKPAKQAAPAAAAAAG
jgi:hypothetical protein